MKTKFILLFLSVFLLSGCSIISPETGNEILIKTINLFTFRIVNYLYLAAGFIIFAVVTNVGNDKKNTAISLMGSLGMLAMIISIPFYYRMTKILLDLTETEILLAAIDRSLAHAVVSTATVLFLTNLIFLGIFIFNKVFYWVLDTLFTGIEKILQINLSGLYEGIANLMANILVFIFFAGTVFGYYLLMVATIDWQMILFGNFDRSLGLSDPSSSFNFTSLIQNSQIIWDKISSYPAAALLIASIPVFVSFINKTGKVIDQFKEFRGRFKKQPAENKEPSSN